MAQNHLTRSDTVRAAITFVDAHGLDALTMRRLGQSLGVEAMASYRHVMTFSKRWSKLASTVCLILS